MTGRCSGLLIIYQALTVQEVGRHYMHGSIAFHLDAIIEHF